MVLDNYAKSDLKLMIGDNEKIYWQGRPQNKCYILEGIFNPLLPFALIWFLFDAMFFFAAFSTHQSTEAPKILGFMLVFLAFHLMPVWIYLFGALFVFRRYKHTEYIVTDKGVYISGGLFAYTCEMKPFTEVSRINIHRGLFDQYLNVGDVELSSITTVNGRQTTGNITIADIQYYKEVFTLVKKLQTDIYADTMYPNELRPKENSGYQTKYTGVNK